MSTRAWVFGVCVALAACNGSEDGAGQPGPADGSAGTSGAAGAGSTAGNAGAGETDAGTADAAGTAGADAGANAALAVLKHPHDVTAVEGTSAVFAVVASGEPTFEWQLRAPSATSFVPLAAESDALLVRSAVSLSDHDSRFRVALTAGGSTLLTNEARLRVLSLAQAARAYLKLGHDPTVYTTSAESQSSNQESASVDLETGELAVSLALPSGSSSAQSGIFQIRFRNHSQSPVLISSGNFRVRVEGTYQHVVKPIGASTAYVDTTFQVSADRLYQARGRHTVHRKYDENGQITAVKNDPEVVTATHGALVSYEAASETSVVLELVMPELQIGAGGQMTFSYQLHVVASNASASFSSVPARVTLTLPAGVLLSDDLAVEPSWVVSAP